MCDMIYRISLCVCVYIACVCVYNLDGTNMYYSTKHNISLIYLILTYSMYLSNIRLDWISFWKSLLGRAVCFVSFTKTSSDGVLVTFNHADLCWPDPLIRINLHRIICAENMKSKTDKMAWYQEAEKMCTYITIYTYINIIYLYWYWYRTYIIHVYTRCHTCVHVYMCTSVMWLNYAYPLMQIYRLCINYISCYCMQT